jgi:hypothetical protein
VIFRGAPSSSIRQQPAQSTFCASDFALYVRGALLWGTTGNVTQPATIATATLGLILEPNQARLQPAQFIFGDAPASWRAVGRRAPRFRPRLEPDPTYPACRHNGHALRLMLGFSAVRPGGISGV